MSREQLGDLVGVSASALEAFEAGRLRLSPSLLIDIAKALRAPISYFFAEIRDLDE
jgi:transcriptional regulator with XRE-family HTH domain